MTGPVGLAVFGLGSIGRVHVQNIILSARASLKWIVRNNKRETEEFLKARGITAGCATPDNLEPVWADPSVSGIVICSPSNTHEHLITEALKAGKAVFCEKPVTTDLKTAETCYELAEKRNLSLFCAFHRRFDPSFRQVYDKLRTGSLGSLRLIRTSSRDYSPPSKDYIQSSGGIFIDTVVHDIDVTSWIVGSKPIKVFSRGHSSSEHYSQSGDIDLQVTSVEFKNGVIGVLDNLRQSVYGYDQRLEAVCDKGMLTVDNHVKNLVTEHGERVTSGPRVSLSYIDRYREAYQAELEHFIDAVQGKCEIMVTKEQTLQTMRLAEACKLSFQSGQQVDV